MKRPCGHTLPHVKHISDPFPKWRLFWRHAVMLHGVLTSHHSQDFCIMPVRSNKKKIKSHFLTWWPWHLTYDPDHQTRPRYSPGQPTHKISCWYIKRFIGQSAHRLKDDSDSMTSSADAGDNQIKLYLYVYAGYMVSVATLSLIM